MRKVGTGFPERGDSSIMHRSGLSEKSSQRYSDFLVKKENPGPQWHLLGQVSQPGHTTSPACGSNPRSVTKNQSTWQFLVSTRKRTDDPFLLPFRSPQEGTFAETMHSLLMNSSFSLPPFPSNTFVLFSSVELSSACYRECCLMQESLNKSLLDLQFYFADFCSLTSSLIIKCQDLRVTQYPNVYLPI